MMNTATGYSQPNMMWGHPAHTMPGYSPSYHHPKAGPSSQDPYGYGALPPTVTSLTFPSPTAARSFTEPGSGTFSTLGPQGVAPTQGSAYFAPPRQDTHAGGYAPPQQRLSKAKGQASHYQPPLREAPPRSSGRGECQEECAEEECLDSEQCGDEQRPPKPDELCLGVIDKRPLLPLALTMSTICGLICIMLVQVPMLARLCNLSESTLYMIVLPLYVITLIALAYSALADPGQLHKGYAPPPPGAALMSGSSEADAEEEAMEKAMPKRAHKCWQYKRPVRRYDHYCRWLTNVIGLTNHREFLTMVVGLVAIGLSGICLDVLLMIAMEREGKLFWGSAIFVILHLVYSIGLTGLAGPILRIHMGLVSRNEVAHEWKKNTNYIVRKCKQGEDVEVNALSDDEFNALFDAFVYDRSKNPYDKGCVKNCWVFWCTSRRREDELGEF